MLSGKSDSINDCDKNNEYGNTEFKSEITNSGNFFRNSENVNDFTTENLILQVIIQR